MKKEHPELRIGQVRQDEKSDRWLLITFLYEWKPGLWRVQARRVRPSQQKETDACWSTRLHGPIVYRWEQDSYVRSRTTVEMNGTQMLSYPVVDACAYTPNYLPRAHEASSL